MKAYASSNEECYVCLHIHLLWVSFACAQLHGTACVCCTVQPSLCLCSKLWRLNLSVCLSCLLCARCALLRCWMAFDVYLHFSILACILLSEGGPVRSALPVPAQIYCYYDCCYDNVLPRFFWHGRGTDAIHWYMIWSSFHLRKLWQLTNIFHVLCCVCKCVCLCVCLHIYYFGIADVHHRKCSSWLIFFSLPPSFIYL